MNKKLLAQTRALVKGSRPKDEDSRTFALYNILSAIRGPDDIKDRSFKPVTIAIRAYVGFDEHTCSGLIHMRRWPFLQSQFEKLLDDIMKVDLTDYHTDGVHYLKHLKYAVKSIGRQKLLDFVKESNA